MQHLQYIEPVLHHNLICSFIDNIMCLCSRKRKYINIHYLNKGLFCFLLKYLFTFIFLKITVEKELYTKLKINYKKDDTLHSGIITSSKFHQDTISLKCIGVILYTSILSLLFRHIWGEQRDINVIIKCVRNINMYCSF